MAKIIPVSIVQGISGKICRHDDTYFATNKQTNDVYAVKVCNPSTAEPTEKQLAVRQLFGERSKIAAAWLKANAPSTINGNEGTEAYQKMMDSYKSQHKIGNISAYVRSHIDKDGKVTFGGTQSSGSGSSTNGPGGGYEG